MLKSFILAKLKLIGLMEKEFASLKILTKLFMDNFTMVSCRVKDSCILQLGTIILGNLDSIKNKEEVFITGLVRRVMFMRESLKLGNAMEEELSGGVMEVGMRANSEMVFKVDGGYFIDREVTGSMRAIGTMECLTVKVHNTSKTEKDMREHLNRTSSMETVSFIKMIRSFMVFGRTTNYL